MNDFQYLTPLFWDQPQFRDPNVLRATLENGNAQIRRWILLRFLQYARVKETFAWFSLDDIRETLDALPRQSADRTKWIRLLEVYGTAHRG